MSEQTPKALKIVVISMGVMLLGGFVWVAAVVAQRAGEEIAKPAVRVSECQEISLPRPEGSFVSFTQGEWHVASKTEISRYSECGELIQKTTLTRE